MAEAGECVKRNPLLAASTDPSCLRGAGVVSDGQKDTADRHKSQGHPDLEQSPAFKGPGAGGSSLRLISQGDEGFCYFCPEPCSNPQALPEDAQLIAGIILCCYMSSCVQAQRTHGLEFHTLIYFVRKSREFSMLQSTSS